MNISVLTNNTNFKGYDVMPLRGLYMQGWEGYHNQKITQEMSTIANKEGLKLYVNNYGKIFREALKNIPCFYDTFCVWAQDTKNFLCNGGIKNLICNSREAIIQKENLGELEDYEIKTREHLPRGGNFFIGFKPNGEKWIMISSKTIIGDSQSIYNDGYTENTLLNGLQCTNELVKKIEISNTFDTKMDNIYLVNSSFDDLDMLVRPIGYPYVLVNDYNETIKNIDKLQQKFPQSNKITDLYEKSKKYHSTSSELIKSLESNGFIPIKIAGAYSNNINFMNALAFKTKNDGISYITNSTRDSIPEFEYLEKLFEEDLRAKVANIENVYFISGGNAKENGFPYAQKSDVNSMMYWLGENRGGIHCMTAEIPDFDTFNL